VDDRAMEKQESVLVALRSPSAGSVVGTPNAAALEIDASDQRPDAVIGTEQRSGYVGNNVYNSTGLHQTRTLAGRPGSPRMFYARVFNDGNAAATLTIRGTRAAGSTVRYESGRMGYLDWTRDVTRAVRSSAGWRVILRPHAFERLRITVTPSASARSGSRKTTAVTASWRGDVLRVDQVRAIVSVHR
jgi:hypothetical protein